MLNILMIEDEEADAIMLRRAFDREGLDSAIQVVTDGREGVRYILGEGDYSAREKFPFPQVVFVDLNMPVMTGFEVLRWMKENGTYDILPTMVFSSSNRREDIEEAYRLGANAYLVKPNSLSDLQKFARITHEFWTNCAKPDIKRRSEG
jgi:CheY-like chemotaxis protein